jgi:hypothetical protein
MVTRPHLQSHNPNWRPQKEARIKERQEQCKQRQAEFLNEIINTTAKCAVNIPGSNNNRMYC